MSAVQIFLGTDTNQRANTHVTITDQYDGKPLPLVAEISKISDLDWVQHPVRIRVRITEQMEVVNLDTVLPILRGENLRPSFLAELATDEQLDQRVIEVNELFSTALMDYKTMGQRACEDDKRIIQSTSQKPMPSQNGVGRGKGVVGLVDTIRDYVGTNALSPEKRMKQGGYHRKRWIHYIEVQERKRLEKTMEFILVSSGILVENLKESEKHNTTNREEALGLWQLFNICWKVFKKRLVVVLPSSNESVDVSEYLSHLRGRFAVLENIK